MEHSVMSIPVVDHAGAVALLGTQASPVACAASGAYTSTGVFGLADGLATPAQPLGSRTLVIQGLATATTGATTAQPGLIVLFSAQSTKPSATATTWFPVMVQDGSVTATTLNGNLPASMSFTKTPNFGAVTLRPGMFLIGSGMAKATNDVVPIDLRLTCPHAWWFQVWYAEHGDTTHPSNLWLTYSTSI